jgi:ubiquinone/menaquinone biosynthesis C-methylase UbiE
MVTRLSLPFALLASFVLGAPCAAGAQALATEKIFEAIELKEGRTACEIGAGSGELSIAAAKIVGSSGRVYTSELGDSRVTTLQKNVADAHLSQISVVTGAPAKTNFPDAGCDVLFMRDVYHHFTDPAAMTASIALAVKPGGRVAIVDFTPSGEEAARPDERAKDGKHGVSATSVTREMLAAGFTPVPPGAAAQRWFLLVFSKP